MVIDEEQLGDADSPFTQLFSLLKNKVFSNGHVSLGYSTYELEKINSHIDNAMEVLLQGLQDLGYVAAMIGQEDKKIEKSLNQIGFFISALGNLTEALNTLRLDTIYTLKQRSK